MCAPFLTRLLRDDMCVGLPSEQSPQNTFPLVFVKSASNRRPSGHEAYSLLMGSAMWKDDCPRQTLLGLSLFYVVEAAVCVFFFHLYCSSLFFVFCLPYSFVSIGCLFMLLALRPAGAIIGSGSYPRGGEEKRVGPREEDVQGHCQSGSQRGQQTICTAVQQNACIIHNN